MSQQQEYAKELRNVADYLDGAYRGYHPVHIWSPKERAFLHADGQGSWTTDIREAGRYSTIWANAIVESEDCVLIPALPGQ